MRLQQRSFNRVLVYEQELLTYTVFVFESLCQREGSMWRTFLFEYE